jgi:hypothetical protein
MGAGRIAVALSGGMLRFRSVPVERISTAPAGGPQNRCPTGAACTRSISEVSVESSEVAEHIQHHDHSHPSSHPALETFRRYAGIYLGVIAMLLAIASLGGGEATKEMLAANIHASDTYAFYQAKYLRQVYYQTAADQLELQLAAGTVPAAERDRATALIKRYRDTAARYESEPATGDGKKELLAKAHDWEARRDHAAQQTPNFEYGEALFQIAIVIGSVSIVATSRWLLGLSGLIALGGLLLTLNGYFGHLLMAGAHH